MKRYKFSAYILLLTAAIHLAISFPIPVMAAGELGTVSEFDATVTELTADAGTKKEDLALPATLWAVLEGGARREIAVTWEDGGLYEKDIAGQYTLTAVFSMPYTYAAPHPVAIVTVVNGETPRLRSPGSTPAISLKDKIVVIDEQDGAQTGYPSLAAAMQAIGTSSGQYTVAVVGTIVNYGFTAADRNAVRNNGANAEITFTSKFINESGTTITRSVYDVSMLYLGGATVFKDFSISGGANIVCNWNEVLIGSGVTVSGTANIYGGGVTAKTGHTNLTVLGGTWATVCAGNFGTSALAGTAKVTVGGAAKVTAAITGGTSANAYIAVDNNAVEIPSINTASAANGFVTFIGNCAVKNLIAKTELRLADNAVLKLGGTCNNPAASLVFGSGSGLERTANVGGTNNRVKEIKVEGSGARLATYHGAPLGVSGRYTGAETLELDFHNNAAPVLKDVFIRFSSANNADGAHYSFARSDGYTGIAAVGADIVYTDLAVPGYSAGPLNGTPIYVGGHDPSPGVTDVRYSLVPGSDWKLGSGQLEYKSNAFPALGQGYLDNYFDGDGGPNFNYSVKIGPQTYTLFGEAGGGHVGPYYRGYKRSEDGSALSLVFNVGGGAGVFYIHLTVRPGSGIMEEQWEFVSRSGANQTIVVSHFGFSAPAGATDSYCISSAGSAIAHAFHPASGLGLSMYVGESTTNVPSAASSNHNICAYGWNGELYGASGFAVSNTASGSLNAMGIQWQRVVPAGASATGSGASQFSKMGNLVFSPGQVTLRNPNRDDVSKDANQTVTGLSIQATTIYASEWDIDAPAGITVTPPREIAVPGFSSGGDTVSLVDFAVNYSVGLSVLPGTYAVNCRVTNQGDEYFFTNYVTVSRDTVDINTSVVNENNQPNHDALSNITTSAAAPAAGETIYKYCDGKLAWTLDSANYAITGILVDGAPLAADELAAAKAGDSITIPEMAADKDVVIVVREPALIEVAVSKTVSGAYGDKTGLFDFTIYFLGPGGAPLAEGTRIGYIGGAVAGSGAAAPDNGTLILDGDRKATIALGHGQTITFGVGSGTAIRIVESDHSGYAATFIDSADVGATHSADTGLREIVNGSRTFDYTNTRSSVLPTGVSTGSGGKFHLVLLVLLVVAAASVCRASVCAGRARHEGDG